MSQQNWDFPEEVEDTQPVGQDVDLDEDGPLREEYVPKRRSSRIGNQLGRTIQM